ncbi:hypothetical protein [Dyadobacter frigoris]|uniref:hypothetical protein n=1 Tax=Dyadobacter frigoris TaxID=2576211 RepID=UPI002552CB9C|nr:hypothetical protein [Dyadobacter frigoris]
MNISQPRGGPPLFLNPDMIRNYFKIAFRNLCIYAELSFNKYHKNYERIAVILLNKDILGEKQTWKSLPVLCMDESPKQMIKETRAAIEMKPASDTKQDFEYARCGVANIFLVSEPLTGKRYVEVTGAWQLRGRRCG